MSKNQLKKDMQPQDAGAAKGKNDLFNLGDEEKERLLAQEDTAIRTTGSNTNEGSDKTGQSQGNSDSSKCNSLPFNIMLVLTTN